LVLEKYNWPGNIRQLKNIVEQISVIENERMISGERLAIYLPDTTQIGVPAIAGARNETDDNFSDRELMYKFLFDMKRDLNELKKLVIELVNNDGDVRLTGSQRDVLNRVYSDLSHDDSRKLLEAGSYTREEEYTEPAQPTIVDSDYQDHYEVEESLSLEDQEKELIVKALDKHNGKRKYAAAELGISERTLYRKIKEYNLNK
jgi:transcriptional regulator with PAS, ATPase and Fis domain